MATFHDRTVAPVAKRGLLRAGRAPCRVLTTSDVLATIEAEFHELMGRFRPAPLPSLTSAFARRREIFGAFDGGVDHG